MSEVGAKLRTAHNWCRRTMRGRSGKRSRKEGVVQRAARKEKVEGKTLARLGRKKLGRQQVQEVGRRRAVRASAGAKDWWRAGHGEAHDR